MIKYETLLKSIGLSDKEASVYVAAMALGPSPVQPIARKAKVARATTYVVLESLMSRGLVTRLEEAKKTLYIAESPQQLLRFVAKEEETIRSKRTELEQALPELQAFIKKHENKPVVRYFEGLEGLRAMEREMLMHCNSKDTWYSLTPSDHLIASLSGEEEKYRRQRIAKRVPSKVIFTTKSSELKQKLLANAARELSQRKYIAPSKFKSTSGLTIFRDRIAISTFDKNGDSGGIIIESASVADLMREVFTAMWNTLE